MSNFPPTHQPSCGTDTPKGKQPIKLEEFMLKFDQERKAQTTDEMIGAAAQITAIYDSDGVE
jgi:hypothetical protein